MSSTCPHNMVHFSPLAAEIGPVVWGTPPNFKGFRILAGLPHGILVVGISQTLRRWTEGATYGPLTRRPSRWASAHILVLFSLLHPFHFMINVFLFSIEKKVSCWYLFCAFMCSNNLSFTFEYCNLHCRVITRFCKLMLSVPNTQLSNILLCLMFNMFRLFKILLLHFVTVRCRASAVYSVVMSVCLSVCLSQVCLLLKWLNIGSRKKHHVIAQGL